MIRGGDQYWSKCHDCEAPIEGEPIVEGKTARVIADDSGNPKMRPFCAEHMTTRGGSNGTREFLAKLYEGGNE